MSNHSGNEKRKCIELYNDVNLLLLFAGFNADVHTLSSTRFYCESWLFICIYVSMSVRFMLIHVIQSYKAVLA